MDTNRLALVIPILFAACVFDPAVDPESEGAAQKAFSELVDGPRVTADRIRSVRDRSQTVATDLVPLDPLRERVTSEIGPSDRVAGYSLSWQFERNSQVTISVKTLEGTPLDVLCLVKASREGGRCFRLLAPETTFVWNRGDAGKEMFNEILLTSLATYYADGLYGPWDTAQSRAVVELTGIHDRAVYYPGQPEAVGWDLGWLLENARNVGDLYPVTTTRTHHSYTDLRADLYVSPSQLLQLTTGQGFVAYDLDSLDEYSHLGLTVWRDEDGPLDYCLVGGGPEGGASGSPSSPRLGRCIHDSNANTHGIPSGIVIPRADEAWWGSADYLVVGPTRFWEGGGQPVQAPVTIGARAVYYGQPGE